MYTAKKFKNIIIIITTNTLNFISNLFKNNWTFRTTLSKNNFNRSEKKKSIGA